MRPQQRGVSLVEAIVAMAVMAFGMLAVVGLQATMRLNADVAKQRSEAVRIAQEAIENWRGFSIIPTTPGRTAFDDIVTPTDTIVTGYTTNTTYTLSRSVTPGQGNDGVRVVVSWDDRAGQRQSVSLSSVIAAADPALSGVLSIKPSGYPAGMPLGRDVGIPVTAIDRGDGSSAYRPPGASGISVVWVFDNLTGVITSVCSYAGSDLETFNTSSCVVQPLGQPSFALNGYVRFSFTNPADAQNPADQQVDLLVVARGSPGYSDGLCYVEPLQPPELPPNPKTYTAYACRVAAAADGKWFGSTLLTAPLVPVPPDALDLTVHDVCRYSTGLSYDPDDAALQRKYNTDHPAEYKNLDRSLPSQNFLVVTKGIVCPNVAPAVTQAHQPPPPP